MKKLLIIFFISLITCSPAQDVKHFYASAFISAISADISNQVIDRPILNSAFGFVFAASVGRAKEYIWDKRMGRGVFNKKDIHDNDWGAFVGAVCIAVKFDLDRKKRHKANTLEL